MIHESNFEVTHSIAPLELLELLLSNFRKRWPMSLIYITRYLLSFPKISCITHYNCSIAAHELNTFERARIGNLKWSSQRWNPRNQSQVEKTEAREAGQVRQICSYRHSSGVGVRLHSLGRLWWCTLDAFSQTCLLVRMKVDLPGALLMCCAVRP